VLINKTFANAHGFNLDDQFAAIINEKWGKLTVVGIAPSPEFVLVVRPKAISSDFKHYCVLWMNRKAIGRACNMEGAPYDVVLIIYPDGRMDDVMQGVDNIVDRYDRPFRRLCAQGSDIAPASQ
jgi:putative ABC transport system permease protein